MAIKETPKERIRNDVSNLAGLLKNLCPGCKDMLEIVFRDYLKKIEDSLKELQ